MNDCGTLIIRVRFEWTNSRRTTDRDTHYSSRQVTVLRDYCTRERADEVVAQFRKCNPDANAVATWLLDL